MKFSKGGGMIRFHDDRPASAVTMHVDGVSLAPCGGEFLPNDYAWAFKHDGELHYGQRVTFHAIEREVTGTVRQGAIHIDAPNFDALLDLSEPLGLRRVPPVSVPGAPALVEAPARAAAASVEEICARHGVVKIGAGSVAPYEAIVFTGGGAVEVEATLAPMLSTIRVEHEIVDIYVRPVEYSNSPPVRVFEPLRSLHLALRGEWAIVARKRHPSNEPRIVGIMLAKDEADAAPEVIPNLVQWVDALYFFAGDQATHQAILAHAPAGWARPIADPRAPHSDGLRQFLLAAARKDAAIDRDPRPLWVMVVQGDEIYRDDVRLHVMLAMAERATVMACQVATFLLHPDQREGWNWQQRLDKRLTHYIWDFGEHAGFLDFPWIWYDPAEHMRAHPHGIYPAKWAAARPVRKHYPFRSPDQARARLEDRLKSGWQPHYENYRDVFLHHTAAGREIRPYFGWFSEAERISGIW